MPRKKPFQYVLDDLLSELNDDLYNEVRAKIDIELRKDPKTGWSAKIEQGKALITYTRTSYPDASFAHELLHVKYELEGLRVPFFVDEENVAGIIPFLFNSLCHFKFYAEFRKLGFPDDEFLHDNDAIETKNRITSDLKLITSIFKKSGIIRGSVALLMPYILLKSPHDNSEFSKNAIQDLQGIGDKSFFAEVDQIISDWINTPSLDCSLTLARIFKACNNPKVGFSLTNRNEDLIIAGNL
jgi:hypothetical protein